jgi:hypothetical protein
VQPPISCVFLFWLVKVFFNYVEIIFVLLHSLGGFREFLYVDYRVILWKWVVVEILVGSTYDIWE